MSDFVAFTPLGKDHPEAFNKFRIDRITLKPDGNVMFLKGRDKPVRIKESGQQLASLLGISPEARIMVAFPLRHSQNGDAICITPQTISYVISKGKYALLGTYDGSVSGCEVDVSADVIHQVLQQHGVYITKCENYMPSETPNEGPTVF